MFLDQNSIRPVKAHDFFLYSTPTFYNQGNKPVCAQNRKVWFIFSCSIGPDWKCPDSKAVENYKQI